MKILFIACVEEVVKDRNMIFAETWRKSGHDIIILAKDLTYLSNHERFTEQACTFFSPQELKQWKKSLQIEYFADKYTPDCIIEIGGDGRGDVITNYLNVTVPLFYYFTEPLFPRFPLNVHNLQGIFYAFWGAMDILNYAHPYEVHHSNAKFHHLSFGYSPELFVLDASIVKKYDIGFQGCLKVEEKDHRARVHLHMYDLRDRFLSYGRLSNKYKMEIRDHDIVGPYIRFVQECRLFLNVGCDFSSSDARQYHVPALGTVLLQYKYDGVLEDGYIDKKNCLLFSTEQEMDDQIQWAKDHPTELDQIRQEGLNWAKDHTYIKRAEEMIGVIQTWLKK